jgi:hypothetical protein
VKYSLVALLLLLLIRVLMKHLSDDGNDVQLEHFNNITFRYIIHSNRSGNLSQEPMGSSLSPLLRGGEEKQNNILTFNCRGDTYLLMVVHLQMLLLLLRVCSFVCPNSPLRVGGQIPADMREPLQVTNVTLLLVILPCYLHHETTAGGRYWQTCGSRCR